MKRLASGPGSIVTLLVLGAVLASSALPAAPTNAIEKKLQFLHENSLRRQPDVRPTVLAEREINAFVASGGLKLPAGVHSLRFEGQPGIVTSFAKVDFDEVRAGSHSMNPLLSVFSGIHDVVVVAHGEAAHGVANVHVDFVELDDVEVPNFVLALFVEKFVTPKHPSLGIDSRFALPERVDAAVVGAHELTVRQN